MESRQLDRDLAGCTASHQRVLTAVEGLTDDQARRPSLLPGWTVGHVLTHLARNADSLVRVLEGAERGEVLTQYEGGPEGRKADIEAGAGRDAATLVADLRDSIARLEHTWSVMTSKGWQGRAMMASGERPTDALPYARWVESEVHHVDLGPVVGDGYTFADVPSDFVGLEVRRLSASWASRQPMGLTDLPPAALRLPPHSRLAWLLGRLDVDGLAPAAIFG